MATLTLVSTPSTHCTTVMLFMKCDIQQVLSNALKWQPTVYQVCSFCNVIQKIYNRGSIVRTVTRSESFMHEFPYTPRFPFLSLLQWHHASRESGPSFQQKGWVWLHFPLICCQTKLFYWDFYLYACIQGFLLFCTIIFPNPPVFTCNSSRLNIYPSKVLGIDISILESRSLSFDSCCGTPTSSVSGAVFIHTNN